MLYKEDQDVLISVDVFASDRTVRGIIFSLLVNCILQAYQTLFAFFTPFFLMLKFIIKFEYS